MTLVYAVSKAEIVVNRKPKRVPTNLDPVVRRQREREKAWKQAHPEKMREARRRWAERNRHVQHANSHIGTLRCRYPDVADNITPADLANWIKEHRGQRCPYCGDAANHIDHKVPLSKGGEHSFSNLSMICATCNRAKNAMTDSEYRAWIARLKAQEEVS